MRNEPNFQKSQMVVTLVKTMSYNEKCKMDTWSKRTQTNPILPAYVAGKIALSEVEGCLQKTFIDELANVMTLNRDKKISF